jgi:hypothetical protein
MLDHVDCDLESGLAETRVGWRFVLDRALRALAQGATSVVFIGNLRVGIEPWPQDNDELSRGRHW